MNHGSKFAVNDMFTFQCLYDSFGVLGKLVGNFKPNHGFFFTFDTHCLIIIPLVQVSCYV